MKSDGGKLDRSTQARIRRQVVLAVRKGMTQVEVAKVFGMSLRFAQKTCARARDGGLRSLKADERGRPPGAALLDGTQQARIPNDHRQDARSTAAAVLPVDTPSCGRTGQARVRHRSVADHGGTLSEVLWCSRPARGPAALLAEVLVGGHTGPPRALAASLSGRPSGSLNRPNWAEFKGGTPGGQLGG